MIIHCAPSIVFVHGFGGHLTETWTVNGVCWPSAFLKSDVKRARIIALGYDAEIPQLLPQNQDSVSNYAAQLLSDLAQLRTDASQVMDASFSSFLCNIFTTFPMKCNRAILFVVHSIGSTVVKEVSSHYAVYYLPNEFRLFVICIRPQYRIQENRL